MESGDRGVGRIRTYRIGICEASKFVSKLGVRVDLGTKGMSASRGGPSF